MNYQNKIADDLETRKTAVNNSRSKASRDKNVNNVQETYCCANNKSCKVRQWPIPRTIADLAKDLIKKKVKTTFNTGSPMDCIEGIGVIGDLFIAQTEDRILIADTTRICDVIISREELIKYFFK